MPNKISIISDSKLNNNEKNENGFEIQENETRVNANKNASNNKCEGYGINDVFKLSRKTGFLEARTCTKITVSVSFQLVFMKFHK